MARRTKQDAQATRDLLLDTAERVFLERGVSRTSLNEIAAAAGVSRGAIYWHFEHKADLFNAMMDRVSMPMEEALERCADPTGPDALAQVRSSFVGVFDKLVSDPQVRRVFEIAIHKVEYVEELSGVRSRHLAVRNGCLANVTRALDSALERQQIGRQISPAAAAVGLYALVDGLIQNWILDPAAFDLVRVGEQLLDAYLRGLAAAPVLLDAGVVSKVSRQCSRTP